MLSYTQSFVHGGPMIFMNTASLQIPEVRPTEPSGANPLATANIGNIGAQDRGRQSEHECRMRCGR